MQFKRQKIEDVGVNLTPLIDVVFLLLIFFMVSTTFTKESHLELNLPEAQGEQSSDNPPAALEIVIDASGHYAVNQRKLVASDIDTLKRALREAAGDKRDQPMIVTADANTPHQSVVTAMDAAGQLGFSKLSLTTRLPESSE